MESATTRPFTAGRIVALLLIGAAVLGLAYLHFGTGSGPVSVPKGAHAGQLILHPCRYETEKGTYAADCGTLVVRENRADPRVAADRDPGQADPGAVGASGRAIFRLQGGPGGTNMSFKEASRVAGHHDVVLIGGWLGFNAADGLAALLTTMSERRPAET